MIAYSWGGLPESTGRWLQPAIYWAAPVRLEAQSLRDVLTVLVWYGDTVTVQVETMDRNIPQTKTRGDNPRQCSPMSHVHTLSYIAMKLSKIAWSCLMFTLIDCMMYYNTKEHLRTASTFTFVLAMKQWTLAHCKKTAEHISRTIQPITMRCML